MIRDALAALRARRGRTLLAALGVLAASLVVGTSVTVGYSLATGFSRSAEQAQLPDVIARFPAQRRRAIDQRVSALPNLEARSYRSEALNQDLTSGEHFTRKGAITTVFEGPARIHGRRGPRHPRRHRRRGGDRARRRARVGRATSAMSSTSRSSGRCA